MPPPPSLTPAQLALQAERKALKEAKKAAAQAEAKAKGVATPELLSDSDKAKFLKRDWIARGEQSTKPLRIVTWNVCDDDWTRAYCRSWRKRLSVSLGSW
jgi:hypothetical protein